ncbi:MAG: phosphoribosylformylglycinamidine synthase I [Candidatus Gygaella obscura]|nr:phosphoribosylformylglycinamidine synthase I [Candidatus Gygaella obscura]
MKIPKVLVIRTAGTNCDVETSFAFKLCSCRVDLLHINKLVRSKTLINKYNIIALPGGFSYGDDIAAGKILSNELRYKLKKELKNFVSRGGLIIGICNGFQVLIKSGLLPGSRNMVQEATLTVNDSNKFEDRWVYLKSSSSSGKASRCVWTKGLSEVIYLPVAHGEGKFVAKNKTVLRTLEKNNQIVFRYCNGSGKAGVYPANPNGSVLDIAGICDTTGRVLGLMPHPERHIFNTQHPRWTRNRGNVEPDGLKIFKNAVNYLKKRS